tara:strand:+ start:1470 stop:1766 length:297 start_codon:yes stop_codon:yes gene_type:complete
MTDAGHDRIAGNLAARVALEDALVFEMNGSAVVVLRTDTGELQVFADGIRRTRSALRRGTRSAVYLSRPRPPMPVGQVDEWDEEILDGLTADLWEETE